MNANDLFNAVFELDLDPIKTKLMHVESGEGWSEGKANLVEKEYRRFLCLMKLYPNENTAPLEDVDTFWHYHILDTMKYAEDCHRLFGYFLHHYPYVGLRGANDEQFRIDSGERMRTLYEDTFGESYPVTVAAVAGQVAYCAGPEGKIFARAGIVSPNMAYCAGPESKFYARAGGLSANTAYCAGPESPAYARAGTISAKVAYCAGPENKVHGRAGSISANTAYCAGPESRNGDYRNGLASDKAVAA